MRKRERDKALILFILFFQFSSNNSNMDSKRRDVVIFLNSNVMMESYERWCSSDLPVLLLVKLVQ